jgi:hypothetical protein
MRIIHLMAAAAAMASLAGCGDQSRTYDVPIDKAFSKIRDVSYSGRQVGDKNVMLTNPNYRIVYNEPRSIEWRFTRKTHAGLFHDVVTATLEPVDSNRTRIDWQMRATDSTFTNIDEQRDKRIYQWDSSRRILREQVDSTLQGRPFDGEKVDEA